MIFYTIKWGERTLGWAGTQAEAKQIQKEQQALYPGEGLAWVEEDVPTNKPSLLAWLNVNATGGGEAEQ